MMGDYASVKGGNENIEYSMTRLSVNINKVATIRNARGGNNPNILKVVRDLESFGAEGITVHPRPDERHIRYEDVRQIRKLVTTEFNVEGYPDDHFMNLVCEVCPDQVTLVPDPPGVLTSNAGWIVSEHKEFLEKIILRLKERGIRTSIFVGTELSNILEAYNVGTDRVELYTEPYAKQYHQDPLEAGKPFVDAASYADSLGLGVNAGHDLDLNNLSYLHQIIPFLAEVSIGHALVCDALYLGFQECIQRYLKCLS